MLQLHHLVLSPLLFSKVHLLELLTHLKALLLLLLLLSESEVHYLF